MIFITLGSQKFQFNRLLEEIDKLVELKIIKDDVFAQIGYSDYKPKSYKFKEFLDRTEYSEIISKCDTVITHGGTGAIVGSIKQDKKVIAIPRLKQFGEHVDDHQLQITSQFKEMDLIETVNDISELANIINTIGNKQFKKYESNTNAIIASIDEFISIV
ncbi:MAG: PssE/Cps14G family polysaccharide biosynthesis glycosyltransferase [Peptostreptococcaceae bacterium]